MLGSCDTERSIISSLFSLGRSTRIIGIRFVTVLYTNTVVKPGLLLSRSTLVMWDMAVVFSQGFYLVKLGYQV